MISLPILVRSCNQSVSIGAVLSDVNDVRFSNKKMAGSFKKNGSGKGNWGRLGDEAGASQTLHRGDPMYDPLESEMSMEQALWEHEQMCDVDG